MFQALDTVTACLEIAPRIVAGAQLQRERIAARLDDGFLDATALMEYLIGQGIPMRSGHEIVGKLVATCEAGGTRLRDLSLDELRAASDSIDEDVYEILGAELAAAALCSEGSGGLESVERQLSLAGGYWTRPPLVGRSPDALRRFARPDQGKAWSIHRSATAHLMIRGTTRERCSSVRLRRRSVVRRRLLLDDDCRGRR
jgi:hypothetical protein